MSLQPINDEFKEFVTRYRNEFQAPSLGIDNFDSRG
jgi:hypothetical protein